MGLFSFKNSKIDILSKRIGMKLMIADDQSSTWFMFGSSGGGISDNDKNDILSLINHVITKGKKSALSNKIAFNNYKGTDVVVFLDDNGKISFAYPITLRKKGYGCQVLYDLIIVYNAESEEYNVQFINDISETQLKMAKSDLSGDKQILEIFLNYGIGVVRNQELFVQLKESKEVIINGFLLRRQDNKITITIESENLLNVFGNLKCEILNETFLLLIDYWYAVK